jgi:hypothetical protein
LTSTQVTELFAHHMVCLEDEQRRQEAEHELEHAKHKSLGHFVRFLAACIANFSGRTEKHWTADDFLPKDKSQKSIASKVMASFSMLTPPPPEKQKKEQ